MLVLAEAFETPALLLLECLVVVAVGLPSVQILQQLISALFRLHTKLTYQQQSWWAWRQTFQSLHTAPSIVTHSPCHEQGGRMSLAFEVLGLPAFAAVALYLRSSFSWVCAMQSLCLNSGFGN